jgi:transposase
MVNYREIIRLKSQNYSNQKVATSCGSSRNTVSEVWERAQEKGLWWPIDETLSNEDIKKLLYPERSTLPGRKMPDYEYIHKELAKPGVTLSLLWAEYCETCMAEQQIPYQHTQFNDKYHAFAASQKSTLRIKRKPGEIMEVDWAGDTMTVFDKAACEPIKAYLFVACLPCSLYSYAEAFVDRKEHHWIEGHIHAYHYFDGSTRILTPDNLKTGVIKNTHTELVLNRSYYEMAEHYGAAIIPARPYSPKDKSSVEGSVGVLKTWILAALRNRKFFTFEELNDAIRQKLLEFNERPFQKKKGSRRSAFLEEEKDFLLPLPASPYETAIWKTVTIQPDYLITAGDCKYSVPYEFIGKQVDVRSTEKCIEVFYHNNRIASHVRKPGMAEPIYLPEHMPQNHRKYLTYTGESFMEWAMGVGNATLAVTKNFLHMQKVEQQGYKSCISLMKLADRYSTKRLEKACEKALGYTPSPSLKNISMILKNGQDNACNKAVTTSVGAEYGITRGADYYKGGEC